MNPSLASYLFQEDLYTFGAPTVIVLSQPWESYSEEEQKLLNKILSSVKLDINAVQIIAEATVDLSALRNYAPARVLIFGARTTEDIPLYQSTTAHGFIVIRADDLNLLDDQRKKNLWVGLRQMFM